MGNVTKGGMALTLDDTNTPHSIKIVPLQQPGAIQHLEQ